MHDFPSSLAAARRHAAPADGRALGASRWRRAVLGATVCLAAAASASAYTVTLTPAAPQTVYLQVGVGSFSKTYISNGSPGNNSTINLVSTTVPAAAVGNGTAQAMTTNSTATNSFYDNFVYCSVPGQVYIGGFYRTTGATTAAARVTATVPAALVSATGDTIPFSTIQWTSSGNGDAGAEPFPAGNFVSGGVQTVGTMASNTWNESCLTFTYANATVPAAGTFTGRVLYTLSSP
jgi:hypothetical protein